MPSLREKLDEATSDLQTNDIIDHRRDASLLVALALGRDRAFIIAHPEYELTPDENDKLDALIARRAAHEPYQYISGRTEFYGLDFVVTRDVLIPRPETEMVVERSIEILSEISSAKFCEIGVGSGCISVATLVHARSATAVGLDISDAAINVASRNAAVHGVADRLTLLESDLFSAIPGQRFDLIVSNPPYVPAVDLAGLQSEVRDFEPHVALFGGDDGLSIIRKIVVDAPNYLLARGHLLLEIGFDQSRRVADMFDSGLWHPPDLLPDLQGIPRLVSARLK